MSSSRYEIRVEGAVPPAVLENLEGVESTGQHLDTTLLADLPDAAALNGLLVALRRAGLILLDVRRQAGPEEPPS
jgi:hypothetical protein